MRTKLLIGVALAGVLATAGCGSSKKTSSVATTPGTSGGAATKVAARTYNLKLSGKVEVPAGAPGASGKAAISIRGKSNELCWSFRGLKNVAKPSAAHIHQGAGGASGPIVVPLGGVYTSSGCIAVAPALLGAIERSPKGYYVNVHTAKFPGGAVRAQL